MAYLCPRVKEGQFYGYKIRGDYNPAYGLYFNEHKLLIDPCAKALSGKGEECGQPAPSVRSRVSG